MLFSTSFIEDEGLKFLFAEKLSSIKKAKLFEFTNS